MFDRTFSGGLGPHFAQLKHIGGGGDGSVYSGFDTRFDFPVCIKRLSVTNKDDCRAALREIRIRRRIRHENILGLLNAVTSDGVDVSKISPTTFRDTTCIFFVQELLDADLRQVIESNNRLSDEYVKLFFYQLLRGLKYIHSANVLHRDLKTSNVLVNVNSLELMIGDFGHAIVLDPDYIHTTDQINCNTSLWYKAPELIVGPPKYSTASDMWAAGCILAEMLLGRPLFEGENDLEQLELIIHTIEINERDQSSVRQCLTEEVNKMYTGKPKFPLRSKFQKVDFHALHLLEHLLSFNAGDRVTTELALKHPFLQEYSCVADEPSCLKPLHVEHEVDDFLEYTLKDLIIGECVSLAGEQPSIHMQMSSYSSIMDIVKELNNSPTGSMSHSVEDGKPGIAAKGMVDDRANDSDGDSSRFKVLEVLKEEHSSSSGESTNIVSHEDSATNEEPLVSDHAAMVSSHRIENEHHKIGHHRRHSHHRRKISGDETNNGMTPHEECVSQEPLVSDHAHMMGSERWKHERHKVGHRRHHTHHRRKTSADESSRCRKTKAQKNHHLEHENLSDSNVVDHLVEYLSLERCTPDNQSPTCGSYSDLSLQSDSIPNGVSDADISPQPSEREKSHDDDKVTELINKSQQLIADHLPEEQVSDGDSQSTNDGVMNALKEDDGAAMHLAKGSPVGAPEKGLVDSVADATVADVIRRSRELLGEVVDDHVTDSTIVTYNFPAVDVRPEYTLEPMVSDPYHLRESNERMHKLLEESHVLLSNLPNEPLSSGYQASNYGSMQPMGTINDEPPTLTDSLCTTMHPTQHESTVAGVSTNMPSDSFPSDETLRSQPTLDTSVDGLPRDKVLPHPGADIDLEEMKAVLEKAKELLEQIEEEPTPPPSRDRIEGLETSNESHPSLNVGEIKDCKPISSTVNSKNMTFLDPPSIATILNDHPNKVDSVTILDEQPMNVTEVPAEIEKPILVTIDISVQQDRVTCNRLCPPEPAPAVNQSAIVFENAVVKQTPDFEQSVLCKNVATHARKSFGKPSSGNYDESQSTATNATVLLPSDVCPVEDFNNEKTSQVDEKLINPTRKQQSCEDDKLSSDSTEKNLVGWLQDTPQNLSPNTAQNDEHSSKFTAHDVGRIIKSGGSTVDGGMSGYWKHETKTAPRDNKTTNDRHDKDLTVNQRGYSENRLHRNELTMKRDVTETCGDNKLTSKGIVGKFCPSNCRTAEKSAEGLLSKDEAGLKTFYATIRINTLMNRSRTYRDRLHEPYPF